MNALDVISQRDLQVIESEPRIHDLRLGERLEFDRPRKIRDLIQRNLLELERYGSTCPTVGQVRGNETTEYWLNEAQALLICTKSDTDRAANVRQEIIYGFMAWRHGTGIAPVTAEILDTCKKTLEVVTTTNSNVIRLVQSDQAQSELQQAMSDKMDIMANSARKDFRAPDIEKMRVTCHKMGGLCPCGCGKPILDENGKQLKCFTVDHYNGRENRNLKDGWPSHIECNQAMRNPAVRRAKEHRFKVFHEELEILFPGAHAKQIKSPKAKKQKSTWRPKKNRPTISQPGQKSFL